MANTRLTRRAFPAARALALTVSLLFTACGGGSDGGGPELLPAPTAPVTISAANGAQVAAGALEIAMGGVAFPMFGGGLIAADGAPTPRILGRMASDAQARVSRASSALVTGAAQSQPCMVSGSITISDTPTAISITYNQCSDYEGQVLNGTMSMTDFAQTGDGVTGSASGTYSLNVTMTDPATTLRMLGGMRFEETWTPTSTTSRLSGSYLGVSDGVTTEVLSNFSISETLDEATGLTRSSSSFTLASTALGGVVTVATPTPFESYPFYAPHAGVLVVTGGGGAGVRLTVLGSDAAASPQVQIEIDADANGVYETVLYRDWFELAAG